MKEEEKKPDQERYLGVTYVSIQSSQMPQELFEHLEKFVMSLHKCRMLVYTNIQSGKPGGCPNGICHE